jgi:hypothetical protein
MNKKLFIYVAFTLVISLGIVFYVRVVRQIEDRPMVFDAEELLLEMNMDDKIKTAELIVMGEVKSNLPSRWNGPNGSDLQSASPQEIANAGGLFTDSIISINKIWKGDIVDAVVRVRSFIGETSEVRWVDEYEPSFVEKRTYLLFLARDTGATVSVDPGYYVPVNAGMAVYEIVNGKAISKNDRWALEELIAYIEASLSQVPTP